MLPPTRGAVALAISRVFPFDDAPEAESAAPTCSPLGRVLSVRPRVPLLLPFVPVPDAFVLDPEVEPGVPEAPGFPAGLAANVPRRLPPGVATGPVGATGLIPNAISRPDEPLPPAPPMLGGGATGCRPPPGSPPSSPAQRVLFRDCELRSHATTWLAILKAPASGWIWSRQGGLITDESGPDNTARARCQLGRRSDDRHGARSDYATAGCIELWCGAMTRVSSGASRRSGP